MLFNIYGCTFVKDKLNTVNRIKLRLWGNFILWLILIYGMGGERNPSLYIFFAFSILTSFHYLGKLHGLLLFLSSMAFFSAIKYIDGMNSIDILYIFMYTMISTLIIGFFIEYHNEKSRILDKKVREFESLFKLSRIIDKFPSTQIILDKAAEIVAKTLEINECIIMLYDNERNILSTRARYGNVNPNMEKATFKMGEGVSGKVLVTKESIISSDLLKDKEILNEFKYDFGLRSCAIIPLINNGVAIGVIAVYSIKKYEFTKDTIDLLNIIASRIVKVLENDRLYKEVHRIAITDGLTRLYNHRYFYETLDKNLKEAKTNQSKLYLLMIDIDKFKSFNDKYGHVVGDKVLYELARVIKENIRSTDIAARYGGEEFAIILPNSDGNTAYKVALRIKEKAKEINKNIEELMEAKDNITVSIGIACYPHCAKTIKKLIDTADLRMYCCKDCGGDKVISIHGA